jgi:hypothetical protein
VVGPICQDAAADRIRCGFVLALAIDDLLLMFVGAADELLKIRPELQDSTSGN